MANLVVHFEIHASEPARVIEFYSTLLGWRFTHVGGMDYWIIDTGEDSIQMPSPGLGINGGLAKREGPSPEIGAPVSGCTIVVGVNDVDATFDRALELGGTNVVAPNDMQGVGRGAYVLDPDHNVFGLISPVLSDGTTVLDA